MRSLRFCFALAFLSVLAACSRPSDEATSPQIENAKEPAGEMAEAAPSKGTQASADAATSAGPLSAAQLAVVYKVLGLTPAAGGQVMNACDEAVTPGVYAAELGGEVGTATLFVMGGGPNTAGCYGDGPAFWLLKAEGDSFRVIFQDKYYFSIMPTEHNGVKDIAVGGPGFEFPVYEWNGKEYVFSRKIKDTEIPPPLNQ